MTTSSIAQRQKAAVATLDFNADCWTFGASPDIPTEGHDARSRYVEEFWLPVLGPTCIVILRHLVDLLRRHSSFGISLKELPHHFGLGSGCGPNSVFGRSITRLVGGGSCQGIARACLVRPWSAGRFGVVEPLP